MRNEFATYRDFADEIGRREHLKKDLIVPANGMAMIDDNHITIGDKEYGVNSVAHAQFADKLSIPKRYYDNMAQIPGLRQANVNAWLHESDKNYMVRTLDGDARALLSDRYKPMDNYMLVKAFLPVLNGIEQFKIMATNITDTKMYLQVVFPGISAAVKVGDIVQWGVIATNSEVGHGAFDFRTMIYRLSCKNGMIGSSVLKRNHVGGRIGVNEEDYAVYADDTIEADAEAFKLKIRDVLLDATSEISFQREIEKMRAAAEDRILKPETMVKNVTKHFNMNEDLSELILSNMVENQDMSRWGLANGVTALAHTMESADRQYEVEKIGNEIIQLAPEQWEILSA